MDTHHKGQAVNGYGAIPMLRGVYKQFGAVASTTVILKTDGAKPTYPLFVQIIGVQTTAFDGVAPVGTLKSTDIDGVSNPVNEVLLAGIATPKTLIITKDRIYSLVFDPTTSTVGAIGYVIKSCGLGQL